jgi:hypothetical protein
MPFFLLYPKAFNSLKLCPAAICSPSILLRPIWHRNRLLSFGPFPEGDKGKEGPIDEMELGEAFGTKNNILEYKKH